MDNSKRYETWTPVPEYKSETRTDMPNRKEETITPQEKFDASINSIDDMYRRSRSESLIPLEERQKVLKKALPELLTSVKEMGGLEGMLDDPIRVFLEEIGQVIREEGTYADLSVRERYELIKPALEFIDKNTELLNDREIDWSLRDSLHLAESNDDILYRFLQDPEHYKEPVLKRDSSLADLDIEKIKGINPETFRLSNDDLNLDVEYYENIQNGEERVDDPRYALLDLAWQVKYEDGKSEYSLDKLKKLIDEKGERFGFIFAVTFLNHFHYAKIREDGRVIGYDANVISESLQEFNLDCVENYLNSINRIDSDNARDLLRDDLLHLGFVIDRSVGGGWDEDYYNEVRVAKTPASNDTYLNFDNLSRLFRIIEDFRKKPVVKEYTHIESKLDLILGQKGMFEEKGIKI